MRNWYVVSYDVRDSNRLRRVYLKMRAFGDSLQYSVFLCELSRRERAIMMSELTDILKPSEDSIMIINIGSSDNNIREHIEIIGIGPVIRERAAVVV